MKYTNLLAKLLHYANSDPPAFSGEFYDLKKKLLQKYAKFDSYDVQEIVKECWGDWMNGCHGKCKKCNGTGIYSRTFWLLKRWKWGEYSFHTPDKKIYEEPEIITIRGKVVHKDYAQWSSEARLWLYLLSGEFRLFFKQFRGGYMYYCRYYPLLNIQRIHAKIYCRTGSIRRYFKRAECWRCHKSFWTWGQGNQYCPKCTERIRNQFDDIPF